MSHSSEPKNDDTKSLSDLSVLKIRVKSWLLCENEIKKLQLRLKELKKKKKDMSPEIVNFMNKYEVRNLNIQNQRIKVKVTKQKEALTKRYCENVISKFFNSNFPNNESKAKKLTSDLLDSLLMKRKCRENRTIQTFGKNPEKTVNL